MLPNRLAPWILLLLCCFRGPAHGADKPTYWTLIPKADDRLPDGKMTVVGGKTNPVGVHFQLKDLKINQPASILVVSVDSAKVLELRAFKEEPEEPLVTKETNEKGVAEINFRTGETMYFRLASKGDETTDYQLVVCVGPEVSPPGDDYFATTTKKTAAEEPANQPRPEDIPKAPAAVPVEQPPATQDEPETRRAEIATPPSPAAGTPPPALATPAPAAAPASAPADAAGSNSGFQTAVIVLLGLIFVALAILILVLLKKKPNAAAVILWATATLLAGQSAGAEEGRIPTVKITKFGPPPPPGLVSRGDEEDPAKDFIVKNKAAYDTVKKADAGVRNMLNQGQTLRELLEYYEIIDGKEKLVVADLSPRGLPKLPSSYRGDLTPTPEQSAKFNEINGRIRKAHEFLEKNYVVYKQTMITTGRIKNLQKAAANMNSFAQLALMMQPATLPAEKAFNDKYDGAVENGLEFLDEALKAMSEYEEKEYGFKNWYAYNGLHFYNYMLTRYTRK